MEVLDYAAELREEGKTYREITRIINARYKISLKDGYISYRLNKLGYVNPNNYTFKDVPLNELREKLKKKDDVLVRKTRNEVAVHCEKDTKYKIYKRSSKDRNFFKFYKYATMISEYDNFYLMDTGNYKITIPKMSVEYRVKKLEE